MSPERNHSHGPCYDAARRCKRIVSETLYTRSQRRNGVQRTRSRKLEIEEDAAPANRLGSVFLAGYSIFIAPPLFQPFERHFHPLPRTARVIFSPGHDLIRRSWHRSRSDRIGRVCGFRIEMRGKRYAFRGEASVRIFHPIIQMSIVWFILGRNLSSLR